MALPTANEVEALVKGVHGVRALKQGGQKAVYVATHERYGAVAVKVVLDDCADERIRREIEIAMSSTFPHVPRMYDWGEVLQGDRRTLYVVEQFVPGCDLRQVLVADRRLPFGRVLRLLADLLETAAALEGHGVVHRDIMDMYLQFGHGMLEHTRHLIGRWRGGTVILSPRDMAARGKRKR